MADTLREKIKKEFEMYLDGLSRLVQIKSIEGPSEEKAPFGTGPKKALETALILANEWGFHSINIENAIGYAEWINDHSTNDYVGILGHLDVVPAGSGWSYSPFATTVADGKVFGRGVLDNKGPTIASLFALKLLKESGKVYSKNVRLIFGTNEETGSKDLPYYLENNQPPMYGFTPDSQFPAVYGEKGVVSIRCYTTTLSERTGIRDIQGEFISSSVPAHATVIFDDGTVKNFTGISSPSNEPQLGKNALTMLADALRADKHLSEEMRDFFSWIAESFHQKVYGEGLSTKDLSGWDIQITPYNLVVNESEAIFELSLRYSIEKTENDILKVLKNNCLPQMKIDLIRSFPPKIFDRSHPMLALMKQVYEDVTGLDGTPIITTGATYARFMPNIIAFGPSFPGQIGIAHNSDEYMNVDDLITNIDIYARLLDQLLK